MTEDPSAVGADAAARDPFDGPDWAPAREPVAEGTAPPVRRRRRVSRRRLRRRRRIGLGMILFGAAIVVVGGWILVTGLLARHQLQDVRDEVRQLRTQIGAGDLSGARATAAEIGGHAHRAHRLTTGPAWAAVAALPGGGEPLRTVRAMTAQVDAISHEALPQLIKASHQLDPATLRRPDGSFDLDRISAATPPLDRVDTQFTHAISAIAGQPAHTWLGPVDSARSELLGQLSGLAHTLHSADLAAHIAPPMLGQHGVKHYFVAFQNDAEARGTGGLPGAFAIVRTYHGKITFDRFESDSTLTTVPTGLDFGSGYDQLFQGAQTTTMYGNSNMSPNFPYAAQVWIAMWRKHSGEHLDGAFAVDPTALSYLLSATGPATLPDKTEVTAGNVVALTQSEVYAKFSKISEDVRRKQYLLAIARAASEKILESKASTTALVKAAARAASERRLLAYSAQPAVQRYIARSALSGVIPRTSRPYVGLSIVNAGGNKLDYYLDRSITWRTAGCGAHRNVTVTVRLTNNAPASGLSPTVTHRSDPHSFPIKPGDNRLAVAYYATAGATMSAVDIDGKPRTAAAGADLGHPVFTVDLELPRGATRTITLHLVEPGSPGKPIVLRQPLVRPLGVSIKDSDCG